MIDSKMANKEQKSKSKEKENELIDTPKNIRSKEVIPRDELNDLLQNDRPKKKKKHPDNPTSQIERVNALDYAKKARAKSQDFSLEDNFNITLESESVQANKSQEYDLSDYNNQETDKEKQKKSKTKSRISELENGFLSIQSAIEKLTGAVESLKSEYENSRKAFPNNQFSQDDGTSDVKLLEGGKLVVNKNHLRAILGSGKVEPQIFVARIFADACGVENIYRRTRTGSQFRIQTDGSIAKAAFSIDIYNELIDSAKFYCNDKKDLSKDSLTKINTTISTKLQNNHNYLMNIKNGKMEDKVLKKISDDDRNYFRNKDLYEKDTSLFGNLDKIVESELTKKKEIDTNLH